MVTPCSLSELEHLSLAKLRADFRRNGFCVVPHVIPPEIISALRKRFSLLFAGKFETGVFPDEWHWRAGISKPSATREIVNAWKSDLTVASIVLNSNIGQLVSSLMEWKDGARIAQDDVLFKPAGAKKSSVGYHTDGVYISDQFEPRYDNCVTVWMPLTDVGPENGTIEYASGSHLWGQKLSDDLASATESDFVADSVAEQSFHGEGHYRTPVMEHACALGIDNHELDFVAIEAPAGSLVLHAQDTWHGSAPNLGDSDRYAVVSHIMKKDLTFREDPPPDYIYGRYKRFDSLEVDESFFPEIWPGRSPAINHIADADLSSGFLSELFGNDRQ